MADVLQIIVRAIEGFAARRETAKIKADPRLCALAAARESVRAGDVVYGVEAARALVRHRQAS